MNYQDFLETKRTIRSSSYLELDESSLNPQLFPFQKAIVKWALKKGKAAIFAACGLGKTPMQLEWAKHIHNRYGGYILILAPLAVAPQTVKEGNKFGIEVNFCKSTFGLKDGINIANYDVVDNFDDAKLTAIILDESSILKNLTGKMRNKLISRFADIPFKLCCSATPAPNDHKELGNHSEFLNIMNMNEMLSKYFINDASRTGEWKLKNHAIKDFWLFISSWAVCLNKPSDIGFEDDDFILPALNWHQIIAKTDISGFEQGRLFADVAISATNLYRNLRKTIPERIEVIAQLVKKSQDYWIIWVNTNYEADYAKKVFLDAVDIRGSESPEVKEKKLSDFSNGHIRKIITKPTIAGFGLNWQHCHNMVFLGINYSFEQSYQAVRRCWRFQQEHPVNAYVVISETEQGVMDNIKVKAAKHEAMEREMVNLTTFSQDITTMSLAQKGILHQGQDWQLYQGDSVEIIKTIPDESIHFSIFSPPFSNIFVYSDYAEDMGNCTNDDEFFRHFDFMIPDLRRITLPGRLCAVHCSVLPTFKFKDGEIGLKDFRGEIIRLFQKHGWIFHSEVCIWKCPVIEMTRTKALGLLYKQLKKDSSRCRTGLSDYLVVFRKPGENPIPIIHSPDDFSVEEWQKIASPIWMDIRQTNTLNTQMAKSDKDEKHICPLQLDVIYRANLLWSNPGETVFSPFAGIGSEGYQSLKMGRKFIGIELKPEYVREACINLNNAIKQKGLYA